MDTSRKGKLPLTTHPILNYTIPHYTLSLTIITLITLTLRAYKQSIRRLSRLLRVRRLRPVYVIGGRAAVRGHVPQVM